jgi:hypothetical protein
MSWEGHEEEADDELTEEDPTAGSFLRARSSDEDDNGDCDNGADGDDGSTSDDGSILSKLDSNNTYRIWAELYFPNLNYLIILDTWPIWPSRRLRRSRLAS